MKTTICVGVAIGIGIGDHCFSIPIAIPTPTPIWHVAGCPSRQNQSEHIFDGPVKSRCFPFSVIPAQAGIQ